MNAEQKIMYFTLGLFSGWLSFLIFGLLTQP